MKDHLTGRESRAAAAAQAGFFHDVRDVGRSGAECLFERAIAAALAPAGERDRVGVAEMLRQDRRLAWVRFVGITHDSIDARR
jgi:hypothetical protein